MIPQYITRTTDNPADTTHMQSVLQKKPEEFFSFPKKWQEWFLKHPKMLHSTDKKLSPEAVQKLLYDKIITILHENKEGETREVLPYMALLVLSGLEEKEIIAKIQQLSR